MLLIFETNILLSNPVSVNRKDAGKIDYCLFCNAEYKSNISKHYISIHEKEDRVLDILANPLKSKRRKYLLLKLQNEGNFKHNAMVSFQEIFLPVLEFWQYTDRKRV